jgi:hypothetical protein
VSETSYNEIPGADYSVDSISTPNEDDIDSSVLVEEKYFSSTQEIPNGNYTVKVTSKTSGTYYLDYRSYDVSGYTNGSSYRTGTINATGSVTETLAHLDTPMAAANATLKLSKYQITSNSKLSSSKATIDLLGNLERNDGAAITLKSSFQISIGQFGTYLQTLKGSDFRKRQLGRLVSYTYEKNGVSIELFSTGAFTVRLQNVDVSKIPNDEVGMLQISSDTTVGQLRSQLTCAKSKCELDDSCLRFNGILSNVCRVDHFYRNFFKDLFGSRK